MTRQCVQVHVVDEVNAVYFDMFICNAQIVLLQVEYDPQLVVKLFALWFYQLHVAPVEYFAHNVLGRAAEVEDIPSWTVSD